MGSTIRLCRDARTSKRLATVPRDVPCWKTTRGWIPDCDEVSGRGCLGRYRYQVCWEWKIGGVLEEVAWEGRVRHDMVED